MNEEQNNGQRTLSVNGEAECIEFLRSLGLNIDHMYLTYMERWKANKETTWRSGNFEEFEKHYKELTSEFDARSKFIRKYGFSILTRKAIEAMRPYAPLLEIGAGSGYWTYELRKWGIDCIATDTMSSTYGFFDDERTLRRWDHHYTHIEILDCVEAVRKYPNRNLLTCWPDYNESWAADTLGIFTGQVVIYHGEGYGNACADDRFHEILDQRFSDQEYIRMPHFEYSYDRDLIICKKPKQLEDKNYGQTKRRKQEAEKVREEEGLL